MLIALCSRNRLLFAWRLGVHIAYIYGQKMLDLLKRVASSEQQVETEKTTWLNRLRGGLRKTRHHLVAGLARLVLGQKTLGPNLVEDIEHLLLSADVGMEVAEEVIQILTEQLERKQLADGDAVWVALRQYLLSLLQVCEQPLCIDATRTSPYVVLLVGINGVGKTTTSGKLAHYFKRQGKQVLLASGDTFRAGATEQLSVWAERSRVPLIAQHQGADSASVIYDALQAARARNMDILIADTAGRLHTQDHLMRELHKVERVMTKLDGTAPHETWLVLDASIGQNSLVQTELFHRTIRLTGIVLTKLDGTAKGGVVFSIAKRLGLPIRFVGVGEGMEDLHVFSAEEFIQALFSES